MSTRNVSSKRTHSTVATDVMARRTRTTGGGTEVYGADTLPVLIRLPDLTSMHRPMPRVSQAAPLADDPLTVAIPLAAAPDPAPPRHERDRKFKGRSSQDRSTHPSGRTRRGVREEPPTGWLHGAKQFLVAAVLAGVLFGVVVTIKEWNRESPKPGPAVFRNQIDASTLDFGQPELAPAANANFDRDSQNVPLDNGPLDTVQDQETGNTLQGIVPAGLATFDAGPSAEATTHSAQPVVSGTSAAYSAGYGLTPASDRPVAPEATGYADGAGQASGALGDYPTTGVEPIRAGSLPTGPAADASWPPARVPSRPTRSADRGPSDMNFRQR
ncbi:MAG: hypothetical protein ACYC3X_03185 [Pirellulaceae bacterium]